MTELANLPPAIAAVFGFFGAIGFLADVVAPAVMRRFPALEAKVEAFYESLPMSGDDWDE